MDITHHFLLWSVWKCCAFFFFLLFFLVRRGGGWCRKRIGSIMVFWNIFLLFTQWLQSDRVGRKERVSKDQQEGSSFTPPIFFWEGGVSFLMIAILFKFHINPLQTVFFSIRVYLLIFIYTDVFIALHFNLFLMDGPALALLLQSDGWRIESLLPFL